MGFECGGIFDKKDTVWIRNDELYIFTGLRNRLIFRFEDFLRTMIRSEGRGDTVAARQGGGHGFLAEPFLILIFPLKISNCCLPVCQTIHFII